MTDNEILLSSQHQTSRKQLDHRRNISFGICQMHDTGKYKYSNQDGYRDMPCNDSLP